MLIKRCYLEACACTERIELRGLMHLNDLQTIETSSNTATHIMQIRLCHAL